MEYQHLDDEALLRAAYGAAGASEAGHVAQCPGCAAAVAALESQRAGAARAGVVEKLPEAFWQRQRAVILDRIGQPASPGYRRFALAVSALVLLALALLSPGGRASRPSVATAAEDEQLLRDISVAVNRIEPRALAPATLFLPNQIPSQAKEVQRP